MEARLRKLSITVATAVTAAIAATAAAAQDIYRYPGPGGVPVYTDDPAAATRGARKIDLPASAPVPPASPSPPRMSDADRELLKQADARAAALDRAVADIVAAYQALRTAEARRDEGVEPLEGERQGRRHRPEYWQRQHALEQDVVAAKARLDDALARRNALR
jgi:hypothetical protein